MFARAVSTIAFLGITTIAHHGSAQDTADTIQYIIVDGDSLSIIATRYYNAPSAASVLFRHNETALREAYNKQKMTSPSSSGAARSFGPDIIFSGTILNLPREIIADAGRLYQRRAVPMNSRMAEVIGKNKKINLPELRRLTRDRKPKWIKPSSPSPPLNGHVSVSRAGTVGAIREKAPVWYTAPNTDLQRCAKKVCDHYNSLCYFECVVVAKRIGDGGMSCKSLPETLPYEIDTTEGRDCSELVE